MHPASSLDARATELRRHARQARRDLAEIEALPVADAEQLIGEITARGAAERLAEAARQTRGAEAGSWHSQSPVHPPGPGRGFGPSL